MISVYNDADYELVLKQKRIIWTVFWSVTVAWLLFCVGWIIYFASLPAYPQEDKILPQAMVYGSSILYVAVMFPFVGIKLSRVRKYCKMMGFLSLGIKKLEENYFMGFYKKELQKDDVDVISCVFRSWNKKRRDWSEREVYFDNEQDWPELERGDYVRYVVQSNFIIQYEVLRKGAMQEDIAKGLIPKDMMEEDRPVFGKIYTIHDTPGLAVEGDAQSPVAEEEQAEETAEEKVAEQVTATEENTEETPTEEGGAV